MDSTMLLLLLCGSFGRAQVHVGIVNITDANSTIASPNFPNNYTPSSLIEWRIALDTLATFYVNVTALSLETADDCKFDSLQINDYSGKVVLMGPRCGIGSQHNNLSTYFMNYGLRIRFRSDISVQAQGFSLQVTASVLPRQELCDVMHDQIKQTVSTYLNNQENIYPSDLHCIWEFKSRPGNHIILEFPRVDIEFSGPDCESDRLEVWNISSPNGSVDGVLLGRFCGRHNPWTMLTSSPRIRIIFISDKLDNIGGFEIRYQLNVPVDNRFHVTESHEAVLSENTLSLGTASLLSFEVPNNMLVTLKFRTNPGFHIILHTEISSEDAFSFFNGPDKTFPIIVPHAPKGKISSDGFHLVAEFNAAKRLSVVNMSFVAQVHMTSERTNQMFEKGYSLWFAPDFRPPYLTYVSITTKENVRPKVYIKSDIFRNSGNGDSCAYTGVALYDGALDFDRQIGPFCDLNENYVKSLLSKFVGSSSLLYLVMYDYASNHQFMNAGNLRITHSRCKGYFLSEADFREESIFTSGSFSMRVNANASHWNIVVNYSESPNDCFMVHLLPELTVIKNVGLLLRGKLTYRVCRQWGFQDVFSSRESPVSKYSRSENCTDEKLVDVSGESAMHFEASKSWSMEYIRLEMGPASRDELVCPDVVQCSSETVDTLHLSCGIITGFDVVDCDWKIVFPSSKHPREYSWSLVVRRLTSSDAALQIKEDCSYNPNITSVMTLITTDRIGHIRPFYFTSMPGVHLTISFIDANKPEIEFRRLRVESANYSVGMNSQNESCVKFEDNCYALIKSSLLSSWEDERDSCLSSGGDLISVNTLDELSFVQDALQTIWYNQFYEGGRGLIFIGLHNRDQANNYRWTDGSPLTVADWYYPFDGFKNVLPVSPTPPIDLDLIQPVLDSAQRCTAMVPGNPRFSTNWRKIGCNTHHTTTPVFSICEYSSSSTANNKSQIYQHEMFAEQVVSPRLGCEEGWNFVDKACLSVLTKDAMIGTTFTAEEAESACVERGGRVSQVEMLSFGKLQVYLEAVGFTSEKGDMFMRLSSGQIGCVTFAMLNDLQIDAEVVNFTCALISVLARHVICEREPREINTDCLRHQFQCQDATCLNPDQVCDFQQDCSQAEDESMCNLTGVFLCHSGERISMFKYCDFHTDCPDGSDEDMCIHPSCSELHYRCDNGQCVLTDHRCDHKVDCVDGTDELDCDVSEYVGFKCPLAGCIPESQVEDLQTDCVDKTEADEKVNLTWHKRFTFYLPGNDSPQFNMNSYCPGYQDHERCHSEHIKCYPRDQSCIYDHDVFGAVKFCRNGAHLRSCGEFECPSMFKCPKSYCLPHHKVCDGIWDCVKGEDETGCSIGACPGLLRCGHTPQCVSKSEVCDNQVHCKHGWADERFCDLQTFSCPSNCSCFGYTVHCTDNALQDIPQIGIKGVIRILDLSVNNITLSNVTLLGFSYLASLYLSQNAMQALPCGAFVHVPNLLVLDLSHNRLKEISPHIFAGLENLVSLQLIGNPIYQLSEGSFHGLVSLPLLNLSGMYLQGLEAGVFNGMDSLRVIDVSNNSIRKVHQGAFTLSRELEFLTLEGNFLELSGPDNLRNVAASMFRGDSYKFCCYVSRDVGECFPSIDKFNSCSDLLDNVILRIVVWTMAVLALVGNGWVIVWRLRMKLTNAPSVFVFHLSVSDFLMGLYLTSISIADTFYRGTYLLNDVLWRNSAYCRIIGVMASISCEMSMFTLVVIAVDRTKQLAFPLTVTQFNRRHAWCIEVSGWVVSIFVSVLPLLIPSYFEDYYGKNAVCLPFNFSQPTGDGWEFATVIFVALNSLGLSMIFVMYLLIYCRVKRTQKKAGRVDRIEVDVARKLSIVIITNVICLIPVILTNLSSVLGKPINREMASVVTTVMLPLNASLNPYLFTFSSRQMRRRKSLTPLTKSSSLK